MCPRRVAKLDLLAFDIETDTSGDYRRGLKPYEGAVTCIGFAGSDGRRIVIEVSSGDGDRIQRGADGSVVVRVPTERRLLERAERYVARTNPGTLVGWNSAMFDLPFLATRSRLIAALDGMPEPLRTLHVLYDPAIPGKYPPMENHPGGMRAVWGRQIHADIMPAYREFAVSQGIDHKLKAVGQAHGLAMIEVDRQRMHECSDAELVAYQFSDIDGTLYLGQELGEKILTVRDHQFAARCAGLVGGPSRFD